VSNLGLPARHPADTADEVIHGRACPRLLPGRESDRVLGAAPAARRPVAPGMFHSGAADRRRMDQRACQLDAPGLSLRDRPPAGEVGLTHPRSPAPTAPATSITIRAPPIAG